MADKKAVNKEDGGVLRLSLFDLPLATGRVMEKFTLYTRLNSHLTFKNIVLGIGLATFLIFLARAVSLQFAFLFLALMGLTGLMLLERSGRRKWEHDLAGQLQRMNADYERLVRDAARNRNDTASLRKKLSDAAGTLARSYDKKSGVSALEQHTVMAVVEQLSRLSDIPREDHQSGAELLEAFDPAILEKAASLKGADEIEIGKRLTDDQVLQLVNAAVRADRVDLFLQPIVNLPQRKLRFYETFSRIRIMNDIYLPARRYIEIAMQHNLMPVIDNLLLLRGLQVVRNAVDVDYNRAFFFNITSLTLNDPKFMGDLVEFISQNRVLAPQLIFELGQNDLATMSEEALPVLDGLSRLGCRFSMDQVRNISFDHAGLETRHIRFIKIDAGLLLSELGEEDGLLRLKRMKSELDRNGIDMIVEKIETDRQLLELLDIEIDYGQGYLFGKPSLYGKT